MQSFPQGNTYIGAPQILKKTGLTIQAHGLRDELPHSISTGNYKLMFL